MKKDMIYSVVIAGLAVFAYSQWSQVRHLRGSVADLQSRAAQAVAAAKTAASSEPQQSKTSPPGEVATAPKAVEPVPPVPGLPEGEDRARAMELRSRQRMDARMLALRSALSLTEEAGAAVRAALEKGERDREELHRQRPLAQQAVATPEKRREEVQKFAAVEAAEQEGVDAALSEEQRGLYRQHQEQERRTQAEGYANGRLRQLQRSLSLTEDQKDQAFQLYARQAMEFDPVRIAVAGNDPAKVAEQQEQEALQHLERILTAEQYGLFVRQAEERAALNRK